MDQNQLIQVLERVLTPDTETILQASGILKKDFLSKPESLPALIHVLASHENHQVRQLAAVEARSIVPKYWEKQPAALKVQLREALLQAAIKEQQTLVRHSVSRVISEIARIDLAEEEWTELIAFLFQASSSERPEDRETGTYILFTVLESLEDDIVQQWRELFELFSRTIKDPQSAAVRLNTLLALGKMAEFITAEQPDAVKAFGDVLPAMVAVLKELVDTDDDKRASNAFEVFQTLLVVDSALIASHFRDLVVFFLDLASSKNIAESHRSKAVSFLMSCLRYKKLKIQGMKFGEEITLRAMQIVTEFPTDDDEEISVARNALSLLDYLSASLPPSQVVVPLLNALPQYTNNQDPAFRRAGVLSLGMCVEGAPEFVATQIEAILPVVLGLLGDPVLEVRKAALQTIARLADDLPEEIGNAHSKVIPLLIQILDSNDGKETFTATCSAIESALLGVDEDDVNVYLPELMPRLSALFNKDDVELKSAAIAAVGSAASASKEAFQPYFEGIMNAISPFVNGKDSEDELELRAAIIDALCYIANAVGPQAFTPYVQPLMDTAKEGLHLEHPRLKEISFMFFSAMARVYQEDFQPFLEMVVNALVESLEQQETDIELLGQHGSLVIDKIGAEGTSKVSLSSPGELDIPVDDEDYDEDEDDLWEELDSVNALALEKEVAAETLGEILSNCKRGFVPYLIKVVGILASKTQHPYEGVRANAIGTLYRAYAVFFQLSEEQTNSKWEPGLPLKSAPSSDVKQLGELVSGCTLKMLKEERDRSCVMEVCNNIAETLKLCGPAIISSEEVITEYVTQIVLILKKQHPCQQDLDEDEADQPELGDTAEYDWLLIEAAMDMLVGLSAALGPQIIKIWEPFGHLLLRYLSSSEPNERATSVGIIADCIKHMGAECTALTPQLFKIIMHRLSDEDPKTKSHSAYAMGMLALKTNDKQEIINAFPEILQKLEPLLEGIAGSNARTKDNAAGCISRMITAAPQAINLEEVLPALIKVLPLKDDYEENEPIYEMLIPLYQANNETVLKYTPQLLPVFNEVLGDEDQLTEETRNKLVELIKYLHTKDAGAIDSYPTLAAAARA